MSLQNKKGQVGFISLMLGVILFVLALALAPVLSNVINGDNVMGADGMDCDNENITNQMKAVCTSTDTIQPVWFFVVIGLAGILIGRVVL